MKRMSKKISMWLVLMLVTTVVLSSNSVLVTKAEDASDDAYDAYDEFYHDRYEDVNTLGATVTVKSSILKVKANNAAQTVRPTKVTVNGKALKLNKDYTVSYQVYTYEWEDVANFTKTGLYRICIKGTGEYSGVCTKRIYVYDPVQRIPMSSVKIAVNKVGYTGKPITADVIKSVKYKNNTLTEGKDYTVTYLENVNSGTGVVRITGISDVGFVGERDVKFTITGGTKISKAKVTGITAKTYDCGNALTQDMSKVKLTFKGKELVEGTDYVVSYYMNNKKAGTAKIVIAGKGLYNGTLTKSFKINKVKLNAGMLNDKSKSIVKAYTKKAVKPEVSLYDAHGERLVKGVDYTLAYKNNVKMSDKAVITVKGKGSYTGSFKVNFTITDKDIVEQPDEDGKPSEGSGEGSGEGDKPGEGEKPSEGSDEGKTDEGDKPSEGSGEGGKPSEGEKPSEGPGEDNPTGGDNVTEPEETGTSDGRDDDDNNGTSDADKDVSGNGVDTDGDDVKAPEKVHLHVNGVEVEVPEKPVAFRICNCGQVMPVFVYGLADEEHEVWYVHADQHSENGEYTGHTSLSYEKSLKYGIIEDTVFQPLTFFKP